MNVNGVNVASSIDMPSKNVEANKTENNSAKTQKDGKKKLALALTALALTAAVGVGIAIAVKKGKKPVSVEKMKQALIDNAPELNSKCCLEDINIDHAEKLKDIVFEKGQAYKDGQLFTGVIKDIKNNHEIVMKYDNGSVVKSIKSDIDGILVKNFGPHNKIETTLFDKNGNNLKKSIHVLLDGVTKNTIYERESYDYVNKIFKAEKLDKSFLKHVHVQDVNKKTLQYTCIPPIADTKKRKAQQLQIKLDGIMLKIKSLFNKNAEDGVFYLHNGVYSSLSKCEKIQSLHFQ